MEGVWDQLSVKEVLASTYTGRHFPGFDAIDVSFEELEALVNRGRADWQSPLSSVAGIYLITDVTTEKRYVGSASGEGGVWARWSSYILTGHGGNVALRALVDAGGMAYCRKSFRFTLLEHRPGSLGPDFLRGREDHWKRILFTRKEMNRN